MNFRHSRTSVRASVTLTPPMSEQVASSLESLVEAEPSDETLMLEFSCGDAAAFDRLYARHRGPLFRFLQRQCGHHAQAEELFQDVWMALISARARYSVEAKFTTYLYTVARHRVIDHFRRQGVRWQVIPEAGEMDFDAVPGSNPGPDAHVEATRTVSHLLSLVDALPPAQREVMLLRAEAGLTIEEIAQVTSAEPETVKSRLRYALDKLKRGMEGRL